MHFNRQLQLTHDSFRVAEEEASNFGNVFFLLFNYNKVKTVLTEHVKLDKVARQFLQWVLGEIDTHTRWSLHVLQTTTIT